ncbi:MAG: amidohydrolase family protein [Planctomycetes bacterium]|nr:amidohydrolase family protein [Planctomycetota bacterium]
MLLTALLSTVLAAAPAPAHPIATDAFAIRARKAYIGAGPAIEDCVVLLDGGRVREVGRGVRVPDGTPLVEYDGVLTAGLIACGSYDGIASGTTDPTRAYLPEARIADAFAPAHPDFGRLLEAGITSVLLVPRPENVIGGVTALVKTSGGTIVKRDAQLAVALSTNALLFNREPTSYSQALMQLDEMLARPKGTLARAKAGELPVLLQVGPEHEISRAIGFARKHGLKGTLFGAELAGEMAAEIRESGLAVVFHPLWFGSDRRALRSVVALSEAGVPFAFALHAPDRSPEALRISAALCVRAGLPLEAGLQALTANAARIAGVADKLGRVERGLSADLVVWSGDPLDLSSRPTHVYVDGVLAHAAPIPAPVKD